MNRAAISASSKSHSPSANVPALVLPMGLRLVVTAAIMIATIMEILDSTIVNVAVPDMMGNLGVTLDQIGWVATGYITANVIILPLTGWLSDYFGRKKYLAYSVIIFTIASFGCGISGLLTEIIFWRVMQGAGGAAFIATAQATLMEIYPPRQRGIAQAIFSMGIILAPTLGPLIGGALTQNYSWPWIFFVNIPVGVTALLLIVAFVPDSSVSRGKRQADFVGIGLLAIGLGCLQSLLEQGERNGWFSNVHMRELAIVAVIGLGIFLWWELRPANEHPAVNLRVLRFRNLTMASIYAFLFSFVLFGMVFTLPLLLQNVQGYPPLEAGIILVPSGLAAACVMPLVGRLSNTIDRRLLLGIGMVLLAGSTFLFQHIISVQTPPDGFILPLVMRGVGSGLSFVPLSLLALDKVNPQFLGDSSGIYNLFRQLGKSVGVAIIVTLVDHRRSFHFSRLSPNISWLNPKVQQFTLQTQNILNERGLHGGTPYSAPWAMLHQTVQKQAAVLSYIDVFYLLTAICVTALSIIFFFNRDVVAKESAPVH